jgi:NitT/TauT family transport system substrate-binding protein
MVVKLFESLRALFYTPYYVGLEIGAFSAEGLDIELSRPDSPQSAAAGLFDGSAEVTWGGPMRMMQYQQERGDGIVVAFAEAVTRDPFYLVGSEPRDDFHMNNLAGLRVGTVSEVPTPALCLGDDLIRAGVDRQSIHFVTDQTMAENVEGLRRGELDAIQIFEPYVETLVSEGSGHIWYAAASRGPTSYTTLYSSREFADANPDTVARLTRSVYGAQQWLHSRSPNEIAERIGPYFPDVAHDIAARAIERYRANGVWGVDPVLPVEGFVRLKSALLSGGFINRDIPFERCVDNRFALAAVAGDPPGGQG